MKDNSQAELLAYDLVRQLTMKFTKALFIRERSVTFQVKERTRCIQVKIGAGSYVYPDMPPTGTTAHQMDDKAVNLKEVEMVIRQSRSASASGPNRQSCGLY